MFAPPNEFVEFLHPKGLPKSDSLFVLTHQRSVLLGRMCASTRTLSFSPFISTKSCPKHSTIAVLCVLLCVAENHPLACTNFENHILLVTFRVSHRERRVGSRYSSCVLSNVATESQSLKNRDSAQPLKKNPSHFFSLYAFHPKAQNPSFVSQTKPYFVLI